TAPWVHAPGTASGTVTPSRLRSLTPTPLNKHVTKSISTPQLSKIAAHSAISRSENEGMNTIPDPRSPTPQPAVSRNNSTDSSMHPDLSQEVATLSTKLINAINHQTTLDDSLQHTRHELDEARERLEFLEGHVKEYEDKVAKGLLVEADTYNKMEQQLTNELQEERARRLEAEKQKRRVDGEVETLTSALFEEANKMVANARKETEASDKRNEQLKQQIKDGETLQMSLQEQLQDLKAVMERMSERDDTESNTLPTTTAPSTPGITPADKMSKLFEAANLTPNTPGSDEILPEPPLHFSHLIRPVLRPDLVSIKEFLDMLKIPGRASAPSSRVSSGSYGGLNVLGLGSLTNNSTTSLPSSAKSPNSIGTKSPRDSLSAVGMPNLKDEKFYKRALAEDIEPTLRLDIAPGLTWMARRTVLNSITAGSLVVEPHPPIPKFRGPVYPCSLCGEARKGDPYSRKYRFRTSDSDDAQKYPLCDWCVSRVRTTCDYISFLRMVAAGHWRAETEEEKKTAWEESVRLRERMFWTRLGGGVVPAFVPMRESPQSPTFADGKADELRKSEESQSSENGKLDSAVDMSEPEQSARKSEEDPFRVKDGDKPKRVSIGRIILMNGDEPADSLTHEDEKKIEEQVQEQLKSEVRRSMEVDAEKQLQHQRS
ncbi:Sec2p-domain-containing protein, partial [Polyplosphaeria fusca]